MFHKDLLDLYIEKNLISVQKHPDHELYIYNYTPQAQYERVWDKVTTQCRGLILDKDYNVVARPFPKFFNLDEHSRSDILWTKPFKVQEKLDGSLGIMYRVPGTDEIAIATRGSFTSPQALKATKIYQEQYDEYKPGYGTTALFEIIYPGNRIVVNYGNTTDLILLTVIDNKTGKDLPEPFWTGPRAKVYELTDPEVKPSEVLDDLAFVDNGDTEGVVLVFDWPAGHKTRVKVKLEEYKRLHRILTGISSKSIWEILSTKGSMDDILERVPDEFYTWVTDTVKELMDEFNWLKARVFDSFDIVLDRVVPDHIPREEMINYCRVHRKEFAETIKDNPYKSFFFLLLDDKDINDKLWEKCKPIYQKAFNPDVDCATIDA